MTNTRKDVLRGMMNTWPYLPRRFWEAMAGMTKDDLEAVTSALYVVGCWHTQYGRGLERGESER